MKAQITITGQINSVFTLKSKLASTGYDEVKEGRFNSFTFYYDTKKEAVNALAEAYELLNQDDFWNKRVDSYTRGHSLSYDAAKAVID